MLGCITVLCLADASLHLAKAGSTQEVRIYNIQSLQWLSNLLYNINLISTSPYLTQPNLAVSLLSELLKSGRQRLLISSYSWVKVQPL